MDFNFYMVLFESFLSPSEIYELSHIHLRYESGPISHLHIWKGEV